MASRQPSIDPAPPLPFSVQAGRALRRYFLAGLAALFPITVTVFLIWKIFLFADGLLGKSLGFRVPGLGLLLTVLIIMLVGIVSVHFFGRVILRIVEVWFNRLPVVRRIYPAMKQLAAFLFGETSPQAAFRRVVLVEYPRMGMHTIAFVTNETRTSATTGQEITLLSLLVPQPPSPFTGPIIFVPEQDVIPLKLAVEDAIKLIVSGGIVGAPFRRAAG